ncbi:TIGR03619 family F420-dependent LLM class oxidoreductase [Pseudonocardia xishanensis]|uniref:Luciferase-like domain-containing protein n=1 Tax=Pseudonocardia xishanensis TaxID=630995 RepID=A0ABP8RXR6_9PSEU
MQSQVGSRAVGWPVGVPVGIQLSGLVHDRLELSALPGLVADLEQAGADDVVYGEHLAYAGTMTHPSGKLLGRTDRTSAVSDVLVLFAAIAARTQRIRLCTSIVLGALHEPFLFAKQTASVDRLSEGRLVLGVGAGWSRVDFAAVGVPFEERFARMEETVEACRRLWTTAPASFEGRWHHFADVVSEPAPWRADGPPVWWGGKSTPVTARRVAERGDGWIVSEAATLADVRDGVAAIRAACRRIGRDAATVGVRATVKPDPDAPVAGSASEMAAQIARRATELAEAGVSHVTVALADWRATIDGPLDAAGLVAALRGGA